MGTATPLRVTTARDLIPEELFERLVNRIVKDEGQEKAVAERIMTDALAFLASCAANPGTALGPSALVDIGWHTFILYTEEYAAFCQRTAGRFIHHSPADVPGAIYEPKANTRMRAVEAIRGIGYEPDAELWSTSARCTSDCSQCHDGCADSNYAGK